MTAFAFTAVVFLTSAGALVLEIVAARLIAPYVGMSLYTWTAIIAVVLAGLSAGHWLGGRLAGPGVEHAQGVRRTAVALAAATVSTLASLPLLRVIAGPLLGGGMDAVWAVVILTGVLFFAPSLFVGVVSPIVTKLAIDAAPNDAGRVLGRMFAAGAAGSILGTLAAGYLFISWVGATGTVLAVAGLYAVLAIGFAAWGRRGFLLTVLLAMPAAGLGVWGATAQAFRSPCQVESNYFCIRYDDFSKMSGRASRLMVLDHLVHSINDRDDPTMLVSPYVHFVDEVTGLRFAERPPERAFFIGGGGYTLPRAWAARYPEMEMTVAELDPEVTRVAAEVMWFDPAAPGLTIVHDDARVALQAMPAGAPKFDVIFGDAFHDIAVPAHLVTREFHREIAARLTPDGIYALNVVDLGVDPRFLFALVRTLREDFPVVEVWKTEDEMIDAGRVTFIVLAAARATPVGRLESVRGLGRAWHRWPAEALTGRMEAAEVPILTDDLAPVEWLLSRLLHAPDM